MIYNEQQLEKFSQPRSPHEIQRAKDTHMTIRKALEDYFDIAAVAAKYKFKPELDPFLQGSYRNNTHVTQSSDVDVVVCIKNIWKDNREILPPDQRAKYEAAYSNVSYPFEAFHHDILNALIQYFGAEHVKNDPKCIKVLEHGKYGTADVIPSFSYRFYGNFQSKEQDDYKEGICFFANDGRFLRNFPKLHNKALSKKCDPNNAAFKETIRMFKNIRDDLTDRRMLYPDVAKSYFIENLLYFLPDSCFIGTRLKIFEQIMSALIELYRIDFIRNIKCANGIDRLFGGNNWHYHEAQIFFDALKRVQNGRQF
jgi:hypothetical protein